MKSITRRHFASLTMTCAGALAMAGVVLAASAANAADFYKGKTIKVVIRSGPGGGNDDFGRLIARHIGKFIPGNPNTIVQNIPGGGGVVAANYMAKRAKRDGTEIAILSRDLANVEKLGATGVGYKTKELIALGSAASATRVFVVGKNVPVNNLKELKAYGKTIKFSSTGAGTAATQQIEQLKSAGFPVLNITGYDGTQEKVMALVRGEVQATTGSISSIGQTVKDEGFKIIAKMGNHPSLGHIMDIREMLLDPDTRAAANFMAAPMIGGRPFFTAPGVPADRVKILRNAFAKAIKDPDLLKEAKKAKLDVVYTSAADMEKTYAEVAKASDKVVALIKNPPAAAKPKQKAGMVMHKGKVTTIVREGRSIVIDYKGKATTAKVSGSRTKITVKGKAAKRGNVAVGMSCQFTYAKPGAEATNVDCD